jgi:predicted GNAT family acetyltransferase
MPEITIADEPEQHRYAIAADGERVGLAQYRQEPGEIIVTHVEIDDAVGGQGLGSQLVAFLLADARDRGLAVVPLCPFVREYIAGHPEHRDLVPDARRTALGL